MIPIQPALPLSSDQIKFLETYQRKLSATKAAKACGLDPNCHIMWRNDPTYSAVFDEVVGQMLEDVAIRHVIEGVKRPVVRRGKVQRQGRRIVYKVRPADPVLIAAVLKRFRPEVYQDRVVQEHKGSINITERPAVAHPRLISMSKAPEA